MVPIPGLAARASRREGASPAHLALPLAIAALAGILASAPTSLAAQLEAGEARLRGRVLQAESGAPIPGARISLRSAAGSGPRGPADAGASRESGVVLSDRDGAFALAVRAWYHTVRVTAGGFRPLVVQVGVAEREERTLEVRLHPAVLAHEEHLVVTPARQERSAADQPSTLSVVDRARIEERAPQSTPDALADAAGILLQKTNRGAGSPYVRGLVGNQALVPVDGSPLNNATFRYGPNQYLATIDPAAIERLEVLRGSGSVLHGSDAIGGVINLITRQPRLSEGPTRASGALTGRFMTGGMERSGRFEADVSSSVAAFRGGVSVRRFGDLVAGGARSSLTVSYAAGLRSLAGRCTTC